MAIGPANAAGIVTDVMVTCITRGHSIGGSIAGLRNAVVLQNNLGDTLSLTTNGPFTFPVEVAHGAPYSTTVLTQPIGQICLVDANSGVTAAAVTDINVNCLDLPGVSGTVSGLGGSLVLQENGGPQQTLTGNGSFYFPRTAGSGSYSVTIFTQPGGQVCNIANGSGTYGSQASMNVAITCTTNAYPIGGFISGLRGTLKLQNNGGDDKELSSDGEFNFARSILHGGTYSATVRRQPTDQLCTISRNNGFATNAVGDITVSCVDVYTISGTLSGLTGTVELQTGSSERISVSANGSFKFPTAVVAGSYAAQVASQPVGQICTMTQGSGTVVDANVTQIAVTCSANTYSVGGDIIGLKGEVVLQNNGGDNKPVSTNGQFTFSSRIAHGNAYAVTVLTQPIGQTCAVTKDTGIATANVTNVVIACATNSYSIGGTVNGLNGSVTLLNSNGETIARSANGSFQFTSPVSHGGTYSVTVSAQPDVQTCTVINGAGTATTNVTQIAVNCVIRTYAISGTINGLSGSIVLRNNGGNDLNATTNSGFVFTTLVSHGSAYSVTVQKQPDSQSCTVTNGSGIATANVSNVAVSCANTYPIGGAITGLNGSVILQNNGANNLTRSTNGVFTFTTNLIGGSTFAVTVLSQPAGQTCTVTNGSGTATAAVTQISVNCVSAFPLLSLSSNIKQLRFSWTAMVGATYYKLMGNSDGASGFMQIGTNLTTTTANVDIAVHRYNWPKASYLVSACTASNVCSDSNTVFPLTEAVKAIGYVKASNTGAGDAFGASIAISGDGKTLTVAANLEDSGTTGTTSTPNEAAGDAGAVYVYTNTSGSWVQQAYIKASNPGAGDFFGASIALSADGNTLAVGANSEDSNTVGTNASFNDLAASAGAVYVFTRSANVWTQQAYLKASTSGAGDEFGRNISLAADGKTLAIGAMYEDSSTAGATPDKLAADSGAVYVFALESTGWRQTSYVKASNIGTGDLFGSSVALSPDGYTLAIGAPMEDGDSASVQATPNELSLNSGATYIFTRNANVWTQQAYLKASNAGPGDAFGGSVALSSDGNTLAVGAVAEASSNVVINGVPNENAAGAGAVYVYIRTTASWTKQAFIKASNAGAGDTYGTYVALSADGNLLAVGAPGEDSSVSGTNGAANESALNSGAVYVYTRSGGSWGSIAFVKAANTDAGDSFGGSVSLSTDGNTLVVGAKAENGNGVGLAGDRTNNTATSAGAAYLY